MAIALTDGARVGVVGGGPAGSFFAYFVRSFAQRIDVDVAVDIYEPRDFTQPGPGGCNMCGGIVSESLVQMLAAEGINLPETIVQRGIDSYVLHTAASSVRIETPVHEKRIAAVHRGGGPRDTHELAWRSLDQHLLKLAETEGASVHRARVTDLGWDDGRPQVRTQDGAATYDLVAGATGVNSAALGLFAKLGLLTRRCDTTKAYITELALGREAIARHFGASMHMFLLDIPRLDCAAIIPKGDFLTVCLLGRDIDKALIAAFFANPAVKRCFPETWALGEGACHCAPKINVLEAATPFVDRAVVIGDGGVTRLYKDGIGAAYRTAKAAAKTAVFFGVAAEDFAQHYGPVYRAIARDNRVGRQLFRMVHRIKTIEPLLAAMTRMCVREQGAPGGARPMSTVLWDMFTGSAAYRDIAVRMLDPRFAARFAWDSAAVTVSRHGPRREARHG